MFLLSEEIYCTLHAPFLVTLSYQHAAVTMINLFRSLNLHRSVTGLLVHQHDSLLPLCGGKCGQHSLSFHE